MKRRDVSLAVGMGVSLLLHGAMLFCVVRFHSGAFWWARSGEAIHVTPVVVEEEHPIYEAEPPPIVPVEKAVDSEFGTAQGKGKAINEIPGETPQKAHQAPEEQAFLSKDAPGQGMVGESGGGVSSGSSATPVAPRISLAASPALMAPAVAPSVPPVIRETGEIGPRPTTVAVKAGVAPASPPQPGNERSRQAAADPAPMSDSESDPFTIAGNVEFVPGRVEAHLGRKVKTTRPKLTLAGRNDVLTLGGATVQLKVKTDAEGNVRDVKVLRTSGSNEIDQPCRVAVFDWWFEPPKNAAGQPIPDALVFNIVWRW
jgi:protein TonB